MKHSSRPKKTAARGKRRTRAHIIADLSLVHVLFFIVNAGFSGEATTKDYGYDLTVNTFDRDGLIEPGSILSQLKATDSIITHADGKSYVFDLEVRDYNLWVREPNPVVLILYDAAARRAYWVYFQRAVKSGEIGRPKVGAKTIRVKVPMGNRVRTSFFRHARRLKEQVLARLLGVDPHA